QTNKNLSKRPSAPADSQQWTPNVNARSLPRVDEQRTSRERPINLLLKKQDWLAPRAEVSRTSAAPRMNSTHRKRVPRAVQEERPIVERDVRAKTTARRVNPRPLRGPARNRAFLFKCQNIRHRLHE